MQKRFTPDAGGVFPEWEEIEFGKLFQRRSEKNGEEFGVDKTISVATMHFKPEGNKADEKSLPKYKVMRTGDIAFEGHINKHFKHGRFVLNDIGDGIISPIFEVLQPVSELSKEVPGFWKYYINYEPVMGKILAKCANTGIMMNRLSIKDFYKQKIKVPCIEEQRKIAAALAAYDEMIAVKTAKLETWQECKKRMVKEIFGRTKRFKDDDGKEFPEWEEKTLGKVCESISDGSHFSPKTIKDGKAMLSVKDMKDCSFDLNDCKKISEEDFNTLVKQGCKPKPGDVLLSKDGSVFRYIFKVDKEIDAVLLSSIAIIRPDAETANADYLVQCLKNTYLTNGFLRKQTTGTAIKRVVLKNLKTFKIPLPCMEEQQKIGSFLAEIDKEIQIQKEFIRTYAEGKKRMMRELMEG